MNGQMRNRKMRPGVHIMQPSRNRKCSQVRSITVVIAVVVVISREYHIVVATVSIG
jgi:hypothetical protein